MSDNAVGRCGRVLVDHHRAGNVATYSRLEVSQARARGGEHIAGVTQIVAQARNSELADSRMPT